MAVALPGAQERTVLCSRCASQDTPVGTSGDVLSLANGASWLRVVERGYRHERDLESLVDIEQRIASGIGNASNGVSSDRYRGATSVDVLFLASAGLLHSIGVRRMSYLDSSRIFSYPHDLYPSIKG